MTSIANRRSDAIAFKKSPHFREICFACRRPLVACYCSLIRRFDSIPRFVVLTQPREAKHSFGTGRMAHLCLSNSLLMEGVDFSIDERVNRVIHDPRCFPVLLYPGKDSLNLSMLSTGERAALVPAGREMVVFVLDGTWKTVRKIIRLSRNLRRLPFVCFDPTQPSNYHLRKQPRPNFYSTIEAIHYVIDLFASTGRNSTEIKPHDNLLEVFDYAVSQQRSFIPR